MGKELINVVVMIVPFSPEHQDAFSEGKCLLYEEAEERGLPAAVELSSKKNPEPEVRKNIS